MTITHEKVSAATNGGYEVVGMTYTAHAAAADVESAMSVLEGRWKLQILVHLFGDKLKRFSELERVIPAVSQKMLTQQLRQLEADGVVRRVVYQQWPPRVEYGLTDWGKALCPMLHAILAWAQKKPAEHEICRSAQG